MPYIGRGGSGSFGIRERYEYTATSGQTAFSGSDINSKTLAFDNGSLVDVLLNGVVLKPTTDYNTSTANTVTLTSGATTSDEVMIIVYDVFALSDAMPKTGGTFSGAVTLSGGVSSSLTVANGLTLTDGNLVVASGHGIDFSATSDGTTMSSELLDDYEEGIITVGTNVGGGSLSVDGTNNHLVYTKVGRVVYITGAIQMSAESGTSGNYIQFTGMPFTATDFDGLAGRSVGYISHDGATVTDGDDLVGVVNEGGAVINLYRQSESGHHLGGGQLDGNSVLYFNFHYFTT